MGRNRLDEILAAVGRRSLAWFGTRGLDALSLSAMRTPELVVSQIAPIGEDLAPDTDQDCLETRLSERADLDRYDIDMDIRREARSLRTRFLAQARPPMIVIAYRPAEFLAATSFCDDDMLTAFNFHLFQRQFEHKPWVERALRKALVDVPMIPTVYLRDTDTEAVRREVGKGRRVGRTSSGSGGAGVFLFASEQEFAERLPPHRDGFVAISPYIEGGAPLNVNACVYSDGVGVFGVSYQLIGIEGLTGRRFGFCGNDFAAASQLDRQLLDEIETKTRGVGEWLHRQGYRGLFGLDLLVGEKACFVSELNPRFQASTPLSALINQELGIPDPATEHVAAFLDLPCPKLPSCAEQTMRAMELAGAKPLAQVIHRNVLMDAVYLDRAPPPREDLFYTIEGAAARNVAIANEAMLFRSMHARQITWNGYTVSPDVLAINDAAQRGF